MNQHDQEDHQHTLDIWLGMWREGIAYVSDVAFVVRRCLAETGRIDFLQDCPLPVRSEVLRDLRRFRKQGRSVAYVPGAAGGSDLAQQTAAALAVVVRAGLMEDLPVGSLLHEPLFSGLEHVLHGERLSELVAREPSQLSVSLLALEGDALRLLLERRVRVAIEGDRFEEELVHRCVARLRFLEPTRAHLTACYANDQLQGLRIAPVSAWGKSWYDVEFDFAMGSGGVCCDAVELESLEELPIPNQDELNDSSRPDFHYSGLSSTTLYGDRVWLSPLQMRDCDALVAAAADGELWNSPYTVVPSADNVQAYVRTALQGRAAGSMQPYAIEVRGTGIVGCTRFWKIDRINRKLEIGGTWLAAAWQRSFVNTEAKFLMLGHAFEQLQCVRVQLTTDELNERSRAAIERLGAVYEGRIRHERLMPDGRKRNSVRYSIIDDEWPAVRERLLQRLGEAPAQG